MNIRILTTIIMCLSLTFSIKAQKVAETVFSSDVVRAGNMTINASGRIFVSISPLMIKNVKVYELMKDGSYTPYPNNEYAKGENSTIKAIIGIRSDSKENLWLLDMGAKQFIVWDTKNEKLVRIIKIPENVIKLTSFLQDFVIDEKHNRVIIADMTQGDLKSAATPAFIVIDIKTGKARRMAESHFSMMPDFEGGFALNPIAIDANYSWIYFGALHGKKVFRVATKCFEDEEMLKAGINEYAPKSYCDGIAVDNSGNVYITNIEENELGVTNSTSGYKVVAKLPEGQSWPDGLWIKNGYLYSTVDQLNRVPALNNGVDDSITPYIIVKTKIIK